MIKSVGSEVPVADAGFGPASAAAGESSPAALSCAVEATAEDGLESLESE